MKKARINTILNIIGMSISLLVFLGMFSQVWFDYRFNRNIEGYKDIYRFETPDPYDAWGFAYESTTLRPYIEAFKTCSPDVVAACDYADFDLSGNSQIRVESNGQKHRYNVPWTMTDSDFPTFFNLDITQGSADNYNEKHTVLLSETYANIIFGNRNPIGETFVLEPLDLELKVVGIYKKLPENCTVINGILINEGDDDLTFPNYSPHTGFFRLREGVSPEEVLEDFRKAYSNLLHSQMSSTGVSEEWAGTYKTTVIPNIRLTPIAEIHFAEDVSPGIKPPADRTQSFIMLSIALLFLLIAIFNYVNFSMASIPLSINDINISKVFGADRKSLIAKILVNNLLVCLISFALAVLLMEILSDSQIASFSCCSLAVADNLAAITISLLIAIASALAGAFLTAFHTTSYAPSIILKGSFALSGKGRTFRRISTIVQYIMSCTFLICGLIIGRQNDYVVSADNGFKSGNVIHLHGQGYDRWQRSFDKLLENPEILEVTCGDAPMLEGLSSRSEMMSKDNEAVWYSIRTAYHNYFRFFDFELVEGRFPDEGEFDTAIINETFARTYPDYKIGSTIWNFFGTQSEIIGIVKDFNARPLLHDNEPMIYHIADCNYGDFYFKLQSDDMKRTISWIKKTMSEVMNHSDDFPLRASFLDDDIEHMYRKVIGQSRLVAIASLLCLLIALVGVFGLVYLETQVMRKEMAIRKVNGATTGEIIRSLLKKYLAISSIGYLIAVPISIIITHWWLSGFSCQTDTSVLIYILAFIIIIALTTVVVISRSYASASENPVDVLKTE